MRTKIVNGAFHLKRKVKFYLEGEIKPTKQFKGRLVIVENEGTTYVVCPIPHYTPWELAIPIIDEGLMIPIKENYDSLEEVK